jgi:uncharacterized protein (DUF1697 family)
VRYVALLRAINVGAKGSPGRIAMADMRARTEKLGYEDVATYIQTGNILLTTKDSAAKVVEALEREFGTRAFVYTRKQLQAAVDANPLRKKGWRSHLLFCDSKPQTARLEEKGGDQYAFAAHGKVLYYAFAEELAGKRRSLDFEKLAGVAGTGRSAKVVDEILERLT